MDGVALLRELRRGHPEVPVVLMTAFAIEVFTILPKPFEIDHLVAVLAVAMGRPVVLVLDDEPAGLRTHAGEVLRAAGVLVHAAADLVEALQVIGRGEADVCPPPRAAPRSSTRSTAPIRRSPASSCPGPTSPACRTGSRRAPTRSCAGRWRRTCYCGRSSR
jgi:CheY-like chemotaxis protein